jgi:hypothetical protein
VVVSALEPIGMEHSARKVSTVDKQKTWRNTAKEECVALYEWSSGGKDRFLTVQHPSFALILKVLGWKYSQCVHALVKFRQRKKWAIQGAFTDFRYAYCEISDSRNEKGDLHWPPRPRCQKASKTLPAIIRL